MQEVLNLTWWLRVGAFSSTVCLTLVSIMVLIVASRRRLNREIPKTRSPQPFPTVYVAHPNAFDLIWILHRSVILVVGIALFATGLANAINSGLQRGDLFGNLAIALQVYSSLSVSQQTYLVVCR